MYNEEYGADAMFVQAMRGYLYSRIQLFYRDFCRSIAGWDNLSVLRNLTFASGHLPDYSQPVIQQLYLLRYFPAYFMEYYLIYRQLLQEGFLQEPFRIASLGTGAGVDYCGLEFALREAGSGVVPGQVVYDGYDRIAWAYRESFDNLDCRYFQADVAALGSGCPRYNIIMFPMSIGEFSPAGWQHILEMLAGCVFQQERLVLISTMRESQDIVGSVDMARMEELVQVFGNIHHFRTQDDPRCCHSLGTDQRFSALHRGFCYPTDIGNHLRSLQQRCAGIACQDDCHQCRINRRPITRTGHARYQIIYLTR